MNDILNKLKYEVMDGNITPAEAAEIHDELHPNQQRRNDLISAYEAIFGIGSPRVDGKRVEVEH